MSIETKNEEQPERTEDDDVVCVLMPGERLRIKALDGVDCEIAVFPLGVSHMRKFPAAIGRLLSLVQLQNVDLGPSAAELSEEPMNDKETLGEAIARARAARLRQRAAHLSMIEFFLPLLTTDGIDLLASCCKITSSDGVSRTIDDFPHDVLPIITRSFVQQSFSHGRIRPWIAAADATVTHLTGKAGAVSALYSRFSSFAATALKTFFTGNETAGPTPVGVSPSSSSGGDKQPDS